MGKASMKNPGAVPHRGWFLPKSSQRWPWLRTILTDYLNLVKTYGLVHVILSRASGMLISSVEMEHAATPPFATGRSTEAVVLENCAEFAARVSVAFWPPLEQIQVSTVPP